MSKSSRTVWQLVTPSVLSLIVTVSLASTLTIGTFIKYGTNGDKLYHLVLGSNTPNDLVNSTHATFSNYYQLIFGNTTLNKILFFMFWMLIGLGIYTIAMIVYRGFATAEETAEELSYVHINKSKVLRQLWTRWVLHILAAMLIIVYSVFFLRLFIPYGLSNLQLAVDLLPSLSSLVRGALGVILIFLSLHVYTVLFRLLFLRVRVFGSELSDD